ncbi:hypothetical protein BDD43_2115 [Mucilaginibacter gracilis]|uniref:Uncharacterized protein n=1 Tax=Mucilaginibacter gracilis TaxID=423350 RepID=A0A495IZL5_9SPHI|nr:hypothetical protein [Mucilaginibacter gracilis]RKR81953.1 hypothetical protein BDD43_2115 [Mucilaginibacter gracilis]
MKKFILIIALAVTGSLYANAQTRVVVTPARKVVVVRRPVRPVVVAPARAVVVRPHVTVVRPVVRKRVVIVHH